MDIPPGRVATNIASRCSVLRPQVNNEPQTRPTVLHIVIERMPNDTRIATGIDNQTVPVRHARQQLVGNRWHPAEFQF